MTVDFSDWVRVWEEYRRKKNRCSMLLLVMAVVSGVFAVADMDAPSSESGLSLLFASFAIFMAGGVAVVVNTYRPDPFVVVAHRRFHDDSLEGDRPFPQDRLPEDGTHVTWLDDGKTVEGRVFVDGTRVTLAPDVKEAE